MGNGIIMADTPIVERHKELAYYGITEIEASFACAFFEVSIERCSSSFEGDLLLAYRRAFPRDPCTDFKAKVAARELVGKARVQAYIQKLRDDLVSRSAVPHQRSLQELERLAFSNVIDMMSTDPNTGDLFLDMKRLTPALAAVIHEIQEKSWYDAKTGIWRRTFKVKFYDKMAAIDKLLRLHGLYKDNVNVNWSLEDLESAIKMMEQKLVERGVVVEHIPQEITTVAR